MNPQDYVKKVLITEARDFAPLQARFSEIRNIRLLHGAIGLASELAEIREMAQKDSIDVVNLKEEMGDLCWYMGIMVNELGLDPSKMFQTTKFGYPELKIESQKIYLNHHIDVMTMCIGISIDFLKKTLMYGKTLNVPELEGHLFELGCEIESALNIYGITTSEAMERNIEKLRARYGEKFTEAAALERNLIEERSILESK